MIERRMVGGIKSNFFFLMRITYNFLSANVRINCMYRIKLSDSWYDIYKMAATTGKPIMVQGRYVPIHFIPVRYVPVCYIPSFLHPVHSSLKCRDHIQGLG
jgi:hypothetical protein